MKKLLLILFLFMLVFVAACGNGQAEDDIAIPTTPTLNFEDSELTLNVGDSVTLSLTRDDGVHELKFATSDESVATVSSDGVVAAISEGFAVITSYMGDISATLNITVVTPRVLRIELSGTMYSLGQEVVFDVVLDPNDDTPYTVSVVHAEIEDAEPETVLNNTIITSAAGLHTVVVTAGDAIARAQFMVFDIDELAREIFEHTNRIREEHGLNPLGHDDGLDAAAQIRVSELPELFSHTRPDGSHFATAFFEAGITAGDLGENLARGHRTAEEAIEGWMNSESHKEAILTAHYSYLGVAVYINSERGDTFWVQVFR